MCHNILSTSYHAISKDCTFDIGPSAPLINESRHAAMIAAEVSAAAVAQASKEFHRMHEPKIKKLRGGYSADAELMFRSWKSDILANINDRELNNKSAIQLIKEQTLDNAHREVEFQLDLYGGNITYQDLLQHLGITFQGGDARQMSWQSSIVDDSTQRSQRNPLPMSYNSWQGK